MKGVLRDRVRQALSINEIISKSHRNVTDRNNNKLFAASNAIKRSIEEDQAAGDGCGDAKNLSIISHRLEEGRILGILFPGITIFLPFNIQESPKFSFGAAASTTTLPSLTHLPSTVVRFKLLFCLVACRLAGNPRSNRREKKTIQSACHQSMESLDL